MSARTPKASPARRLVLDSGALIALSRDDAGARAVLAAAVRRGVPVSIPAVVLAEVVRGGPEDALVNRVVKAVGEVVDLDEPIARVAGGLIGATGSKAGAVDALVVAGALSLGGAVVLTSDPVDLRRLARDSPTVLVRAC